MEKIISFRRNARLPEEFITFFKEFLTIKATGGKTFLHNLANEIISLLHPLPFEQKLSINILRIKKACSNPYIIPKALKRPFLFFKKLTPEQLLAILSMRENNTTPLENPEVFKKAISLLEELPPGMFADILESTKEAKSYQLLLQNAKIFQMAIPILEKLTDKQLVDILSKSGL